MWFLIFIVIVAVSVIIILNFSEKSYVDNSKVCSQQEPVSVNQLVATPERYNRTPQSKDRPNSGSYGLANPSSILRPLDHSPVSQFPRTPASRSRSQIKVYVSPIRPESSPAAALDFVKVSVPEDIVIRAEQSYHYFEKKSFTSDEDFQMQR